MAQRRAPTDRRTAWLVSAAGMAVLLAHLGVSRDHSNWFWGFNHYAFLPAAWSVALVGLGCALCIPWVWSRVGAPRAVPGGEPAGAGPASTPGDVWVAVLCGVVFWVLRAPVHFLGDGRLVVRLLDDGMWFHAYEPLERMVHAGLLRLTRPVLGWDGETVYAALSVAAGVTYAFFALRLGRLLGHRRFVGAFLLTLGTIVLFFGYAESYSIPTAAVLAYLVLAMEHLAGRRSLSWVLAALLVGIALHLALAFLVPSFVYLACAARGGPRRRLPRVLAGAGVFVVLLVLVSLPFRHRPSGELAALVVPWSVNPIAQYTLFSWQHLVDFVNEQVLISPLGWAVALVLGIWGLRNPAERESRSFRFLLVASAAPLAFSVLLRPGLGGSRDWDLWSLGSLPYLVAAAYWLAVGLDRRSGLRAVAWILVVVGFFHTVPWVAVNASERLSVGRFARMLDRNPLWTDRRLAAARAELAGYFYERGAPAAAARLYRAAADADPTRSRYWGDLGACLFTIERFDEAGEVLEQAVRLDPDNASAYHNLGHVFMARGETWKAVEAYRRACRADSTNARFWHGLGTASVMLGRIEEGEAAFRRTIDVAPDYAKAHFNLAQLYVSRGDAVRALEFSRRAVELDPTNAPYRYRLARLLHGVAGREAEAEVAWREFLALAGADSSARALVMEAEARLRELEVRARR